MMRVFLFLACAIVSLPCAALMQSSFVDDAGRRVTLPPDVSRVFAAGAPAEVMLYTLAPDLLVGRNMSPPVDALEFFPARSCWAPRSGGRPPGIEQRADSVTLARIGECFWCRYEPRRIIART